MSVVHITRLHFGNMPPRQSALENITFMSWIGIKITWCRLQENTLFIRKILHDATSQEFLTLKKVSMVKIRFIPPPSFFFIGNMFFWCIFWLQDISSMAFLSEMHNKRDTIFWNIKINRVIIPLRTILHGYRDSEEFSREQRLYRSNCKNYLNLGALPPARLLSRAWPPHLLFLT